MYKRILLFGLIFFAPFLFTGSAHKFYVSITQVDINTVTHKLEISARIFTDDLEATLLAETGRKLRLGSVRENPQADSILFAYVLSSLDLGQPGNQLELAWVGKEAEADVIWLYLESIVPAKPEESFEIRNSYLYERFTDQKNIVNLRFGKETVSQIHTRSHPVYTYRLGQK